MFTGKISNGSLRLYCGRTRIELKEFNNCMTAEYNQKILRDKSIDSIYGCYYVELSAYDFIEIAGFLSQQFNQKEIHIDAKTNANFYANLAIAHKVETHFNGVKQIVDTKTIREKLDYQESIVQYAIDNDVRLTLKLC